MLCNYYCVLWSFTSTCVWWSVVVVISFHRYYSNTTIIIITTTTYVSIILTNRFQVAVRLFSNRSQMTSKCGKNKKVAHEAQPSVSLMFLPHFDVLCDPLLNRRTATWDLFVLYNKKIKIHGKMTFYFKSRHFDRHENSTDVILCL